MAFNLVITSFCTNPTPLLHLCMLEHDLDSVISCNSAQIPFTACAGMLQALCTGDTMAKNLPGCMSGIAAPFCAAVTHKQQDGTRYATHICRHIGCLAFNEHC